MPSQSIRTFKEYIIRVAQRKLTFRHHLALKNINLKIHSGEVVGFVGHNGAGKSTLLKVVAKILKPTTGRVWIKGRIAPLLGVGAGFHPELTGRENVFLNGALLGFSQREMEEKFERIVDFAELWDFIEAPLRTYSSGMRARLGFSIATDVKPDILLIDEILSVGDASFKVKSAERMSQFRTERATILLVSHSIDTLSKICDRIIWIHQGEIFMDDKASKVIDQYQKQRMGGRSDSSHAAKTHSGLSRN